MPDAKRPDPKRRPPASGPGKGGRRPRGASPIRREQRAIEPRPAPVAEVEVEIVADDDATGVIEPIRRAIAEAAEQQSDQRLGSAARRAAILAAVVCVLTLTIAGPVRTYFAQRTEMKQLVEAQAQLRSQIADLEQQKIKLGDPVYIAAQARERLGFVMPGDIPYQVQLPPGDVAVAVPDVGPAAPPSGQPWYTSLWHTIADAPHGISQIPQVPELPSGQEAPPPRPVPPPPGG
ncbi:FtsB family cell division protein [Mycolicibacterium hodleri]|uniref:Septum formation initiator family protein n=1 Tax=Mycolicibacterium hodleri TaxID=49897 RepID=A0A502EDQ2_9MYCO|nr:septum formation initiator family protein [Mycolicibacterium hodleri]TPG35823.1 septum formation initiator family protein [Mycolicibacterium hodleri]